MGKLSPSNVRRNVLLVDYFSDSWPLNETVLVQWGGRKASERIRAYKKFFLSSLSSPLPNSVGRPVLHSRDIVTREIYRYYPNALFWPILWQTFSVPFSIGHREEMEKRRRNSSLVLPQIIIQGPLPFATRPKARVEAAINSFPSLPRALQIIIWIWLYSPSLRFRAPSYYPPDFNISCESTPRQAQLFTFPPHIR